MIIVDIDMPNSCSECPMCDMLRGYSICDNLVGYCMVATFGCPDRLIKDASIRQSFCPIVGKVHLYLKEMVKMDIYTNPKRNKPQDPEKVKQDMELAKVLLGFDTDANASNTAASCESNNDSIDTLNVRSGSGVGVRAYGALVHNTDIRTAREFVTKNVKISAVKSIRGVGDWTFDRILKFLEQHGIVPDYEKDLFVFTKGESK